MSSFEWDPDKDVENQTRHGVSFIAAQHVFLDPRRVLAEDVTHSSAREKRYYCFGEWNGGILTVRFAYRGDTIRIIGAGYWRRGKKIYEQENQVHGRASWTGQGRR